MKILALDLGKFNTMCCFFDTKTRKHEFLNATTDRNYLTTVFKKHPIDLVVMEACGPSGWINDLAVSLGSRRSSARRTKMPGSGATSNARPTEDDALKLARMAAMQRTQAVHMPIGEHREFRSLVKYRKTLDQRINKIKCTIRAWFVNHGIAIDSGDKAWHTGRALINSFRKPLAECYADELWKGGTRSRTDPTRRRFRATRTASSRSLKRSARTIRASSESGRFPESDRARRRSSWPVSTIRIALKTDARSLPTSDWFLANSSRAKRIATAALPSEAIRWHERFSSSVPGLRCDTTRGPKAIYERISGKQKTRKKKAGVALARKIAVIAWAHASRRERLGAQADDRSHRVVWQDAGNPWRRHASKHEAQGEQ